MPPLAPRRKLRNTFFVDTKKTCFLCLEEIPHVEEPPVTIKLEDEGEDDVRIIEAGDDDIHQSIPPSQALNKGQVKTKPFYMRSIYKYLKMSPGRLLSSKLIGGSVLAGSKLLKTDLSVLLCKNCREVTKNLSDLCFELEILQMKVDNYLGKFLEVLKHSGKDVSLQKKFRSKLENPLDMLQASVAELMRKETQTKCLKQLDMSMPRVKISGPPTPVIIGTRSITSVKPSTSVTFNNPPLPQLLNDKTVNGLITPARYKCTICGLAFGSKRGFNQHMDRRHSHSNAGSSVVASVSWTCNVCGVKLSSKSNWIRHTRIYCFGRSKVTPAPPPPSLEVKDNIQADSGPIVTMATSLMQKDVKNAFSTVVPRPKSSSIGRRRFGPEVLMRRRYKCPGCGEMFVQTSSLWRHRRRTCRFRSVDTPTNPSFVAKKNPTPSVVQVRKLGIGHPVGSLGRYKCNECGAGFAHSASLYRHRKKSNHTGNGVIVDKEKKYFCEYCNRGFVKERNLIYHIKHALCENKEGDKAPQPNNLVGNSMFLTTPPPQPPPVAFDPNETKKSFECGYCGASLSSLPILRRHQKKYCPKAKEARRTSSSPSAEAMETDYMERDEQEEEEPQVFSNLYVKPKVEVIEMVHVQLSTNIGNDISAKGGGSAMFLDNAYGHRDGQDDTMIYAAHDERNRENGDENMMILPDTEDPLQY